MPSQSKHSYRKYFTHESVARALHCVLKDKADSKELPILLYRSLDEFKQSAYWESSSSSSNIWNEVVINLLKNAIPRANIAPETIEKYSSLIYGWGCRDFAKIKEQYDAEMKRQGGPDVCDRKECASLFTLVNNPCSYSVNFTAQSVAQAIFDVLHEEPYNARRYADFDEFYMSDVWRKYVSRGNLWHRVTLTVLHRIRMTPSTLQTYSSRMYRLVHKHGTGFNQIKQCYANIVAKKTSVDAISVKLQQVAIDSDDQSDIIDNNNNNNESSIDFFDLDQYPPEFPRLEKNIAGIEMSVQSFESLEPTEELDDNVINAFLLSVAEGSAKQVIPFETFLTSNILDLGYVSRGYDDWLTRADIWGNCAWLLPTHCTIRKASHWSLFIVFPDDKLIVFLCSLHRNPLKRWMKNICAFLDTYSAQKIHWEEWKYFTAKDVPSQKSKSAENSANNCGVHVCLWAYILSSGRYRPYTEQDMNRFRKAISCVLMNTNLTSKSSKKIVNTREAVFDGSRIDLKMTGTGNLLKKSKSLNDSSSRNTLEYISSWMQR